MSLTIAEAAERSGLTPDTLRYYERDGLMLRRVDRSATGHRRYTESDLRWIDLLNCLRGTGMPIREVRQYAELVRAGDGNELSASSSSAPTGSTCWPSSPRSPSTSARSTARSASTPTRSTVTGPGTEIGA